MTKYLYPSPGQLILFCEVSSMKNRKVFTTHEKGTSSMVNIHKNYQSKIQNAKLNAIYKHMKNGGGSDATVTILDYDFRYFDEYVIRKRIQRTDKKGRKQFYSVSISKQTGKSTGRAHLWKKADI